jgi:hypothetical protein
MLYCVSLPYAYFGIIIEDNKCIFAPPIARWMISKSLAVIEHWVLKKQGKIYVVD